jgi:adenylate cyclase
MEHEYERFDIDPSDPAAQLRLDLAQYIAERGTDIDTIRAAKDLGDLHILAWSHIFGVGGEAVSMAEATQRSGLTEAQLQRVLGALGFTEGLTASAVIAEQDVDVLNGVNAMILFLGEEEVMQLTRVIGSSLRRIAEATAATTRINVEKPALKEGSYIDFVRSTAEFVQIGMDILGRTLDRVLRYHMLAVSNEAWDVDTEGSAMTMQLAVGFADMVGFTAHSAALAPHDLAKVIDGFEGQVSERITSNGGRAVKFIGDEVMFTFADPIAACRCAREVLALAADAHIPDVRVGIAFGDVISRYGDYYGPIVNLAARLVDIAPSGGVVVTREIAERAKDGFAFEPETPRVLKGIDAPVEHFRLRA